MALALLGLGLIVAGGWRGAAGSGAAAVPPAGGSQSTAPAPAAPVVASGHRLVRLAVDASAVPPDLGVGTTVDVVAAVADSSGGGQVVEVAAARVAAVGEGGSPVVTLDVDTAGAARLLWAESFAKAVRVLVRGGGADDAAPPDVGGLGR